MEIGYLCYTLSGAGPRIRARNLIEGLANYTSHHITLVTSVDETFDHPDVEIHRILSPHNLLSPLTFIQIRRQFSTADVVHAPVNFYQLIYAKAVYDGPIVAGAGIRHYLFHLNAVRLLGVEYMIETNEFEADIWQNAGINADYIYPAIDCDHFTPMSDERVYETRIDLGIPEEDDIILFVGSLTEEKGAQYIDKIARHLRDEPISVVVVGDGELQELFIGRSDLKYEGFVDNESLPRYYAAADVTLVPSNEETFSIVSVESIACGTPVVTTTNEDCYMRWLFAKQGTYIWADRDVISISSAVHELLDNAKYYQQQRERGFKAIKSFELCINDSIKDYNSIYKDVVRKSG